MNELRQQILSDDRHLHIHKLQSDETIAEAAAVHPGRGSRRNSDADVNQSTYDTFDNCLHIANQMDSILSFYYTEEDKQHTIKVNEIFPVSDPRGPKPQFDVSDLAWDTYTQMHREDSTPSLSKLRRATTELDFSCSPSTSLGT